mmetsp:Transcript_114190/g.285667  ORF Transcript_114190/g.285667 Transcript_114190/m.285667 type:complete len:209 (-) Transcript_114190:128-754(-)
MTLQAKGAAVVCHAEGVMSLAFLRCRRPHRADLQSQRCRRWCLVLRRGAPDLLRFLHVSGQRAELHKVDEKVHNVLIDRQPQGQATQVDTVLRHICGHVSTAFRPKRQWCHLVDLQAKQIRLVRPWSALLVLEVSKEMREDAPGHMVQHAEVPRADEEPPPEGAVRCQGGCGAATLWHKSFEDHELCLALPQLKGQVSWLSPPTRSTG